MASQARETDDEALIEKQSVAWFTRMNGRPSAKDRGDFQAWLAASEAHRRHYEKVEALWSDLGPLAEGLAAEQSAGLEPALKAIRDARRKAALRAGLALGFAALLGCGWFWFERPHVVQDWLADQVTARGEQRTVHLADGSSVLLDADTAIAVDVSPTRRSVRLLRGAAFFEVRQAGIPFVVTPPLGTVTVLGTSFEVAERDDGRVGVTLASGSLQVEPPLSQASIQLRPGESVAYSGSGVADVSTVDVAEITAWRQGRFIFNDMPLGSVLKRLGRYRRGRIVLLGDALAQRRVSGNVTLHDTDAALAALQSSVGFTMTALPRVTLIGP